MDLCWQHIIYCQMEFQLLFIPMLFSDDSEENNSLQHRQNKNRYKEKIYSFKRAISLASLGLLATLAFKNKDSKNWNKE